MESLPWALSRDPIPNQFKIEAQNIKKNQSKKLVKTWKFYWK